MKFVESDGVLHIRLLEAIGLDVSTDATTSVELRMPQYDWAATSEAAAKAGRSPAWGQDFRAHVVYDPNELATPTLHIKVSNGYCQRLRSMLDSCIQVRSAGALGLGSDVGGRAISIAPYIMFPEQVRQSAFVHPL